MTESATDPPGSTITINADRRLRGPYTAAGTLAEMLVPVAAERWPELVAAHDIELRTVAPDLHHLIPRRRQSLAASIPRAERILVPAPQRTLRVANGFAEFVTAHLQNLDATPYALTVVSLKRADPADRELLRVLQLRVPPSLLTLTLDPDAPENLPTPKAWPAPEAPPAPEVEPDYVVARLARAYGIPSFSRAPNTTFAGVYRFAVGWCLENGCHDAAAELGIRGLRFADAEEDHETWWGLVHDTSMALGALGRESEAEEVLQQARQKTTSPVDHSTIAYSLAMVLARHHDPGRRDLEAALGWINTGIALCGLLTDPASRAVKLGFDLNGKALIQSRRGRVKEALDLVQEAIDLADRDLTPEAQPIHRLVLRANRAQLHMMLDAKDKALEDLNAVIDADPGYPDYYLDRGNLLHQMGRNDEAIADYETALEVGLPFPEPYFNIAEIRFAQGDTTAAIQALNRVLDLDPEFVDALVNRAGLFIEAGDLKHARKDVETGLAKDHANPYLRCALGQIELAEGQIAKARDTLDQALEIAPDLPALWATRAALALEVGAKAAVGDLTVALSISEDPTLLYNRAIAYRAQGDEEQARADLIRASRLAPDDADIQRALTK